MGRLILHICSNMLFLTGEGTLQKEKRSLAGAWGTGRATLKTSSDPKLAS